MPSSWLVRGTPVIVFWMQCNFDTLFVSGFPFGHGAAGVEVLVDDLAGNGVACTDNLGIATQRDAGVAAGIDDAAGVAVDRLVIAAAAILWRYAMEGGGLAFQHGAQIAVFQLFDCQMLTVACQAAADHHYIAGVGTGGFLPQEFRVVGSDGDRTRIRRGCMCCCRDYRQQGCDANGQEGVMVSDAVSGHCREASVGRFPY